ncbi:transcription-repair coupling factor [Pseudomonas aeruginosa]|nr:transcription-repair coupling factor [Pseudomonas aeruginosa]
MPVSVLRLPSLPASAGKQHWGNLPGAALSLAVAEAASSAKRFTLLLTADSQNAERLEQELRFFAPDLPVLHFPDWETLPYDVFSPHQDIISQRIAALYQLPQLKHGVLVVPISTALHRLAPTRFLLGSSLVLDVGQKLDVERMRLRLEGAGYRCVDTVYEHGEFAVRGALIDLFPMGSELPFRIDLFDDEIETLRTFDPETQRSIDKVESIRLLPAREFPLNKEAVTGFRGRFRERFDVDYRRCPIYQDLASGLTPSGIEYYLPLFFEETATLFDYLPQDTQVFSLPGIEQAAEQFWNDVRSRYEDRRVDPERPLLPPAEVFLPVEDCFARLKNWPRVVASQEDVEPGVGRERFPALPLPNLAIEAKAAEPLAALRRFIEEFPGRVLFCAESAGRREVLLELLARLKLRPEEVDGWPAFLASQARLAISIAPLDEGLLLEPSGPRPGSPKARCSASASCSAGAGKKTRDGGDAVIKNLTELREGAPVVHIDHGVGRYPGPDHPRGGQPAGGIPHAAIRRGRQALRAGRQTCQPDRPLHRRRTTPWRRCTGSARKPGRRPSARPPSRSATSPPSCSDIYARRAAREGFAFKDPQADYATFSAGFPFEETPDQQSAIEAVVADMLAPRANGPPGLRRRRLRQDRSGDARGVRRRA